MGCTAGGGFPLMSKVVKNGDEVGTEVGIGTVGGDGGEVRGRTGIGVAGMSLLLPLRRLESS
jgi:hypothetical protein